MLIERETVSIPAICLVVSRLPAGKRPRAGRASDLCILTSFELVRTGCLHSGDPERRNQLSLVLASLNTRRHSELSPERIVTNANSISYAFFFRFTPRREENAFRSRGGLLA